MLAVVGVLPAASAASAASAAREAASWAAQWLRRRAKRSSLKPMDMWNSRAERLLAASDGEHTRTTA